MISQPDIPGYTFVGKIADGGMATVWRARQEKLDRVVAIKIMDKRAETDEREVERFIYEARAAASLIHPNIVQVIDAGERPKFMYYVMEYVPGDTAGEMVDEKGALPEEDVLKIAAEVCDALGYAWDDRKVVHCDIKPDNLIIHRNGQTKIADLGLAQVLGKEGVAIDDDMTIGTPNYFPPEQALVIEPFDCRTDMYALGASLYHLGTGELPFGGLEPDQVASSQVHEQLPAPQDVNPDLSKPFCGLVEKLMAKEPEHRHASWEEVKDDINSILNGGYLAAPLSATIKSTVLHTPQPIAKKDKKIIRKRGARPSPKVIIGKAELKSMSDTPLHLQKDPQHIWPAVVVLGIVVGLLYGYSFLF